MLIDLTDSELDYVYTLLYKARPMAEVETIVNKIRHAVAHAATAAPVNTPPPWARQQALERASEADEGVDSLPLP